MSRFYFRARRLENGRPRRMPRSGCVFNRLPGKHAGQDFIPANRPATASARFSTTCSRCDLVVPPWRLHVLRPPPASLAAVQTRFYLPHPWSPASRDTRTSLCVGRSRHPASRDTRTSLCVAGPGRLPGVASSCYYSGYMSTRHALLKLLADGAFHSGPVLGERLGVSRAAVNKAIQSLVESGTDIHRVSGRGYRLGEPFVPLSEVPIRALLAQRQVPATLEIFDEVDSTNQQLLRTADLASGRVCLAEAQSAGRGRRGRGWVATPCHNILMSMSWRFETGPAGLAGLSLAAGVAVLRALEELGVHDAGLKWPNDILSDGRKLAGLLIDLRGEASGPSVVVLGLGLNVHLAPNEATLVDQPWAALRESLPAPVDRNRLAGLLILHLHEMFRSFEHAGFEAFRAEWERRHLYAGQSVRLQSGQEEVYGTVAGIDAQGGLRVQIAGGELRTFHSGDVSLRAARTTP